MSIYIRNSCGKAWMLWFLLQAISMNPYSVHDYVCLMGNPYKKFVAIILSFQLSKNMDHQGPLEVDRITIYSTAKINFSLRVARAKTRFNSVYQIDR